MSKVILLSRVSTEIQTLEQQTNELINEAQRLGYGIKDQIIIEDKESAISLDEQERRGLNKLKEEIENDKSIDCVICYEVSRISRRAKVLFSIRDYLIERKIQLVVITPYMKLLDNDGKMSQTASILFSLFSSISESEMMIKKERMRRGKLQAIKDGKYGGGNWLYGYKFVENQLTIDNNEAAVVRNIFNKYLEGNSMLKISRELLELGVLNCKPDAAVALVKNTLKNTSYYGGKGSSSYNYPPIISKELFDKCRKRAIENRYAPKSIISMVYYCRGILRDGVDKRLLSPSKAVRVYASHELNNNEHIAVNINACDSIMWQVVKEYNLFHAPSDTTNYKKELKHDISLLRSKLKNVNSKLDDLNKQLDRIEKRIIEGRLDEARGNKMEIEIEENIKEVKSKEQRWINEITNKENELKQVTYDPLNTIHDLTILNDEERYNLILKTIDVVYIWKTEKRGTYNLDFHFKNGMIKVFKMCSQSKYFKYWDEEGNEYHVDILYRVPPRKKQK